MKYRAYLDIETTGLNRYYCDLTVIGIALEKGRKCQVVQLIEDDLYEEMLLKSLEGVDEIYTYNGSRFDLTPNYVPTLIRELSTFFILQSGRRSVAEPGGLQFAAKAAGVI